MISNKDSDCDQNCDVTFDRPTGNILVSYDIGSFSSSTKCASTVSPESMGYSSSRNGPIFSIKYNIYSLVTAFSANNDIVPMNLLTGLLVYINVYYKLLIQF